MATMNLKKEEELTSEQKLVNGISNFFEKHLKLVLIIIAVIAVGIIAAVVIVNVNAKAKETAQIKVAALEEKYTELLNSEEPSWSSLEGELSAMIDGSSYPSVKAAYLLGLCYYNEENYAKAIETFEKGASLNEKIFLAPLCLANAAVCADEAGNTAKALELYNKIYNDYSDSGVAPKALFNVARIYLQQGNNQLAKATFQQCADYYPNSEYGKLSTNVANVL